MKREGAHEDSAWAVAWPTEERLISGSIDETVKVRSAPSQPSVVAATTLTAERQVWSPAVKENQVVPNLEEMSTFPGHFLGVVSLSATTCAHSPPQPLRIGGIGD
eukprot:1492014-Rhodomonas_salina.2